MKKLFFLLFLFVILCSWFFAVFAYNLSEKEYAAIDAFEEKLFTIIDEKPSVTPEKVELLLQHILEKRNLSEKNKAIVEIILDDLQYVYAIGKYAYYTETSDICYEDEYFDEEDQRCYFDDEAYSYENETDFLDGDYQLAPHGDYKTEETTAEYRIEGDTIELVSGETHTQYEETWKVFSTLIPNSARKDFKMYKIVNNPDADTLAHVEQDMTENTRWNMTVNIPTLYDKEWNFLEESIATLIHEFAHVLTLNKTQVRYYPVTENEGLLERFAQNCQTNLLQEWCLNEDAYLDDFIDIFWSDSVYLEKVRNEEISAYDEAPSHFITDYAATNPGEDIAESFTYFVLNTQPWGNQVKDKKLLFFYNYKEIVNLRKQIRTRIQHIWQ